ncbi:carboxymuconolactone decarboxylase family protein [Achromobacter sp. Bel]|uniref:carboxymuconolactone decarboxylase family protein n=1 Tax=Achromobacter sp. Bel TaxID=2727415 RepID=UPI00145DE459|nr:carboxymuconolactone decarboxylase family protein [Achromobacter sp. Bel]NMK48224.1 carboxymuconolactone decarboxylase family protein [Achromobacter sp. Bel]
MARVSPPQVQDMSAEQKRIYDLIASGPRGRVRGPLAVWLHRPSMAAPAQALGQFCRYDSSLSPRQSEFGILVLARWWGSEFEWWAHKPIALKAGVSEAVIDALRDGKPIPFAEADEALIHEFLTQLHETRRVSDDVYARAEAMFGQHGVIDLVALAGYYTLISMTLNVFQIDPPEGEPHELKAADSANP